MTITAKDVREFEAHSFSAEASSLRWGVGSFPSEVETTMGNGQPLVMAHIHTHGGDVLWADYLQRFGCMKLRVFND